MTTADNSPRLSAATVPHRPQIAPENPAAIFRRATGGSYWACYSEEMAFRELIQLAADGFAPASTTLGNAYRFGLYGVEVDHILSVNYFRAAVRAGDSNAAMMLGLANHSGEGTELNPKEALQWFQYAAASSSEPAAVFMVGRYYEKGIAVPQDFEMAANHYARAAERGYPDAQFRLGRLLVKGQAGKEPLMGIFWLIISAANGDEEARNLRDRWQVFFRPEEVLKAQRAARVSTPE